MDGESWRAAIHPWGGKELDTAERLNWAEQSAHFCHWEIRVLVFFYSCSIKICASWFDKHLESIFSILLIVETFFLWNVVDLLEEVIVSWSVGRRIWQMRQNFIAQEKNWTISVDQCQLQALQFSVHLIDLLSLLLRWNDYAMIQKAMADQTSSRPSNSDHKIFLVQVWLWEMFWSFFLVQQLSWPLSAVI